MEIYGLNGGVATWVACARTPWDELAWISGLSDLVLFSLGPAVGWRHTYGAMPLDPVDAQPARDSMLNGRLRRLGLPRSACFWRASMLTGCAGDEVAGDTGCACRGSCSNGGTRTVGLAPFFYAWSEFLIRSPRVFYVALLLRGNFLLPPPQTKIIPAKKP